MTNRLADAISPYLRGHADNPVDWWPWGAEAFAEATRRGVPVFVSIGYATCHWCHVMARESFSDPALASYLTEHFVSIKVDREEHPDVDAAYMVAAGAFTSNLGWPLSVFVTPKGRAFFAGSYFPPLPLRGHPSFRQVLEAVVEAWTVRPDEVQANAAAVAGALAGLAQPEPAELPGDLAPAVRAFAAQEDALYGGLGTAPKFPMAPVLGFLLAVGGNPDATALGLRLLRAMAASPLRDPVEGGFFRYSTLRDWGDPHYERMLYDNAQLLAAAVRAHALGEPGAAGVAEGVAGFLLDVMRLPSGAFASAQDSESEIDGAWSEGGYYRLPPAERARQPRPRLDEKVLTGWNGLAIGALARAGAALERPEWVRAAREAADAVLTAHRAGGRGLVRMSLGGRLSAAPATLEDYGMLAGGLLELALATGEPGSAVTARELLDECLAGSTALQPFAVPGGADAVLAEHGLAHPVDPSEGSLPTGRAACAAAALRLSELGGGERYRQAAASSAALTATLALAQPSAFGSTLELLARLSAESLQLVVVVPDEQVGAPDAAGLALVRAAHEHPAALRGVVAVVTEGQAREFAAAGLSLFEQRPARDGRATAYLCRDFVCRLPVTDAAALA